MVAKEEDRIEFGLPLILTILPLDARGAINDNVVTHDIIVTVDGNVIGNRRCSLHVPEASNLKLVD